MVSYFSPISSMDVQLNFVLLADNINNVLEFFLYLF
jgi:hypothetical protein